MTPRAWPLWGGGLSGLGSGNPGGVNPKFLGVNERAKTHE